MKTIGRGTFIEKQGTWKTLEFRLSNGTMIGQFTSHPTISAPHRQQLSNDRRVMIIKKSMLHAQH